MVSAKWSLFSDPITNVMIDDLSMLDYYFFHTAEGLCRQFAKYSVHWGGSHVIMFGDPAQLPAVGRSDLFGTQLWRTLLF